MLRPESMNSETSSGVDKARLRKEPQHGFRTPVSLRRPQHKQIPMVNLLREDNMYRKCVCMAALCLTLALAGNAQPSLGKAKCCLSTGITRRWHERRQRPQDQCQLPEQPDHFGVAGQFPEPAEPGRQLRRPRPRLPHPARVGRVHLLGRRR